MARALDDLIRPYLHQVSAYVPGKPIEEVRREFGIPDDVPIIKLASNENVLGVSPAALAVLERAIHDVWLYPEDSCFYVKQALADYHGVTTAHIYVGNGGVATLMDLGRVLIEPTDHAIASTPSFMKYRIVSQWSHGTAEPLRPEHFTAVHDVDHRHDVDAMAAAIRPNTKIIWLCSPNNPTGQVLTTDEVDRLVRANDNRAVIVLDEAYYDFIEPGVDTPDSLQYIRDGQHFVSLRTLAKIGGLAGLRIGYLIAPPRLVEYLERIRLTFSINRLAQEAAIAAISDEAFKQRSRELVWAEKRYYYERFAALGWPYKETQANFIWFAPGMDSKVFSTELMKRGVIIRPGWIFGEPEWSRVTFGTRAMNERFFEMAVEVTESAKVTAHR